MNKIIIDAFGGDHSPEEIIIGSIDALQEINDCKLVFVGKQEKIEEILSTLTFNKDQVEIVDAKDVITCEEEPVISIRRKPDSSICVALKVLKEDPDAKIFVSAGSTGAVLAGSTLKIGRIAGINRPALCPAMPTAIDGKSVYLMDAGANADCKPINLCQFALMGSVYAKVMGVENPKVALLSNGTEDEKGNALNHEVFPILKEMKDINFVGNIEARDILSGEYDVVVTDGFSGNIAVKSIEGTAKMIMKMLKGALHSSFKAKIGGLLVKSSIYQLKDKMDYNKQGGAFFIGLKKPVLKMHGSSKRDAVKASILLASKYTRFDIVGEIEKNLANTSISEG